jgi:hypothetical protein
MDAYPDAKIVLSIRSPDTWYNSVKGSIYEGHLLRKDNFAVRTFLSLLGSRRSGDFVDKLTFHTLKGFDKGDP